MEKQISSTRLQSLDFMRGLIMVLLMLESTGMYERLHEVTEGSWADYLVRQFFHDPWHGLTFWDLIQPGFMFIAGTALAYSLHRQMQQGVAWSESFRKVLKRSFWLFFLGVLNYAVRPNGLSFELWNVLTQLSFTTLVAFFLFRLPGWQQLAVGLGIVILAELLYRYTNIPGFDQPFTNQHNFGNYMDLKLMGQINSDGWVAINCLSTSLHTIGGVVAGKLLLSAYSNRKKLQYLLVTGLIALAVGFALDFTITPIIKRLATTSFVLASGGWCALGLALFYWWIDIRQHRKNLFFFTVVGMNSILIYLFFEIVGARWFNGYIDALTTGVLAPLHLNAHLVLIISSLIIFALEWLLCYYLYKKSIFIKI
jgi:predicted acyltransferase